MRWIRSNIRGLARLALFALAVQIVVTFGHVHLESVALASAAGARLAAGQAVPPSAKAHAPTPQGTADVDCPICALIQLASTSAPAVAPPLPVPTILGGTILEAAKVSAATVSPIFGFQARGPPAV
jgi:hypothetical protein